MIVALAGGVGGAKLVDGLARLLGKELTVIVNTGDDFEHIGLPVSPDLDTVMYTLAGIANPQTGWGVKDESWNFLAQIDVLGGETWFRLGDRDLAVHALRRMRLDRGETLTAITRDFCARLGIAARILPMADDKVATKVHTAYGSMGFQDYFVRLRCEAPVTGFTFENAENAQLTTEISAAFKRTDLEAIVICPSNPYVSIDPILAIPGMRQMIEHADRPVLAVSPIIAGAAVKGPAAKMMLELGLESSALSVARHYGPLLGGFVLDGRDESLAGAIRALETDVEVTDTLMQTMEDRMRLARTCISFARRLKRRSE